MMAGPCSDTRTGETGPLFPEPTGQMHHSEKKKLSPGSVFYTHESLCARHSFSFLLLLFLGRWKCRRTRTYTTCLPVSRRPAGMFGCKGLLTAEMRRRNKWHVDVTKEQPLVVLRFSFVCLPYFSPFSLLRTCTVQACQFDSYRAVQTHFFCFSPFRLPIVSKTLSRLTLCFSL